MYDILTDILRLASRVPVCLAACPTLLELANFVRYSKASKFTGIHVKSFSDMIAVSQSLSLPPTLALVNAAPPTALIQSTVSQALYVPMQASAYSPFFLLPHFSLPKPKMGP